MPFRLRAALACVTCLLALHASCWAETFSVTREGNSLNFSGDISPASAAAVVAYLKQGVTSFVVTSVGGDAEAGLTIATEMVKHGVDLEVQGYCLSSCANYLFVSAKTKRLRPGAVLGFHGGPASLNALLLQAVELPEARKLLQDFVDRNVAHFSAIGVDTTLFSSLQTIRSQPDTQIVVEVSSTSSPRQTFALDHFKQARELATGLGDKGDNVAMNFAFSSAFPHSFFFPTKATLEKFGIKGVGDYLYPLNALTLEGMADEVAPLIGAPMELVGDFNELDGPARAVDGLSPRSVSRR